MYNLEDYDEKSIEINRKVKAIFTWIIDEKCSIRQVAEELCIPKSTVHTYIHTYIKHYYDEEYQQIIRILRYNKQNRCMPRKYWKKYGL